MRGRAWAAEMQSAEAARVREHIAALELELLTRTTTHNGRALHQIGHELRTNKALLKMLDECVAEWGSKRPD
jgi:hypothetical protein